DAIGKSAQAPIFLLLDLAAFAFDDGLEMGGQCVHLLRADILARDQKMLVKSHLASLSFGRGTKGRGSAPRLGSSGRRTMRTPSDEEGPGRPQPLRAGL